LPLYVILAPLPGGEFREVSRYDEGRITNQEAFLRFLRQPLAANGSAAAAQAGLNPPP
jgi:hypothetical protein